MGKIFFIVLLLSSILTVWAGAFPVTIYSQTATPQSIKEIETTEIKGEVLRRQSRTLTVQTGQETRDVTIPEYVKVTRNTNEANIEDIQPGDAVTILQSSDGQVLSAQATAGEFFDIAKWLLPLLLIIALGVILITYFLRKASKPHIKTSTTPSDDQ